MIRVQDRSMKHLTKKIIGLFILITLITPTAFVSFPQKANAQAGAAASCVAGYAAAALSALTSIPQNILGVPKSQVGDTAQNVVTGGSANALSFNNCILRPLGKIIIITLIRNIGASVVNWVNSGFEGNPTFVTDFGGMLTDTADQAIGTFIEGSDLGFLCNDFGFQVRLALALKYSQPFREQARCTLSQIGDNISTNGGRGWDNFLSVSTEPQNNVYGAYLIAESELAQRAANAVGIKEKRVAIGQGFLDFETCDESDDPKQLEADAFENKQLTIDSLTAEKESLAAGVKEMVASGDYTGYDNIKNRQNAIDLKLLDLNHADTFKASGVSANQPIGTPAGKVCTKKSTKTPGAIIAGKLNSTFAQGDIQQAVAQEIDQVIAATMNQLAQKVIQGATGLLGLSKKRSSSQSYLSKYQSQYYGVNGQQTNTGATSEIQDYQIGSYDQTDALLNDTSDPNLNSINQLFNNTVNSASTQQQEQIASIADTVDTANQIESNTAILKPAQQSSGTNPSGANDGTTQTSQYMRGSATDENDANPWWQVDLGEVKKIKEVRVWAVSDKPTSQTLETFKVTVSGGAGQWSSNLINGAGSTNPIVVPVNQSGSIVRIEKFATPYQCSRFEFDAECYHPLELAEVQVMEEVTTPQFNAASTTSTNASNTPVDDTRTGTSTLSWTPTSPASVSVTLSKPLNQELKLSAEKTTNNIIVKIGLYRNGRLTPFLDVFNTDFDIVRGVTNGSKASSQSVIKPTLSSNQPGTGAIRFGVSVNGNSSYSFTLKGSLQSNLSSGSYEFRTEVSDIINGTETILPDKSQTTSFSI